METPACWTLQGLRSGESAHMRELKAEVPCAPSIRLPGGIDWVPTGISNFTEADFLASA